MSWRHVWRRDLLSTYRSRLVPVVAVLLVAATAGIVLAIYALSPSDRPPGMRSAVFAVGAVSHALVPLAALLASYSALIGERESGSVRFLLGLPNSRGDAFTGKFAARLTAVGALFREGSYVDMVGLTAVTLLFALLFVGTGLALSAVVSTSTRAVVGGVGLFAVFRGGWPALQFGLLELTGADRFPVPPDWYFWVGRVNPLNAYLKLTTAYTDFGGTGHPLLTAANDVRFEPDAGEQVVSAAGTVAVTHEFAAVVLLLWTAVVPLLGFLVWRRRDLL